METEKVEKRLWILAAAAWCAAVAVNCLLAWQQATGTAMLGCASDGQCNTVLSSPFGRYFGVSITLLAFIYFGIVGLLLLLARSSRKGPSAALIGLCLPVLAVIGVVTGIWSIRVMVYEIQQVCLWCLTVHFCTALFFLLTIGFACRRWRRVGLEVKEGDGEPMSRKPIFASLAAAALLSLWQLGFLSQFHDPVILSIVAVPEIDNPARLLAVDASDEMVMTYKGQRSAPGRIVLVSCFTCPSCRDANRDLNEIMKGSPGKVRIDIRFNPQWPTCNRHVSEGGHGEKHRYACQLARIGIAVAVADSSAFAPFVDWLYENQKGMTVEKATEEAKSRVDVERYQQALDSGLVDRRLEEDVAFMQQLDVEVIPAIYFPRGQAVGTISKESLQSLMSAEFGGTGG